MYRQPVAHIAAYYASQANHWERRYRPIAVIMLQQTMLYLRMSK